MFHAVLPLSTEMTSLLGVITPKAMKQDKGREGGHKIGKIGPTFLFMDGPLGIVH